MESLKAKNCNRGQLFRTCWVSSARCSKLYELFNWSTEIHILTKCRPWTAVSPLLFDHLDFSYFPLSRVLHVTLANWQRFGFEFIWGHHHLHIVGVTSWILHSLLHRAEETQQGRNSCPRLQFGFQFGHYRVVAPLSFLRSISLASLFSGLYNAHFIESQ